MAKTGRKKKRITSEERKIWRKILYIALWGVIILIALVMLYFAYISENEEFDPITLCPLSGEISTTVVLLDLGTPLSLKQHSELEKTVNGLKNQESKVYIPPKEKAVVYRVPDVIDGKVNGENEILPEDSFCSPGIDPSDRGWVDAFGKGKIWAEDEWRKFTTRLERLVPDEIENEHKESPILEVIASIVPRHKDFSKKLRLVIWSDLLQHTISTSNGLSHFRQYPDPETFLESGELNALRTNLEGVDIVLFRLANYPRRQNQRHHQWWTEILKGMGANIILDESI